MGHCRSSLWTNPPPSDAVIWRSAGTGDLDSLRAFRGGGGDPRHRTIMKDFPPVRQQLLGVVGKGACSAFLWHNLVAL